MPKARVGVLGATSFVGNCLLPLLAKAGYEVVAFTRQRQHRSGIAAVNWHQIQNYDFNKAHSSDELAIPFWICVAPIWVLPEYFSLLKACGARKVVAVSSTSRFTKDKSSDPKERAIARSLVDAETCLQNWAGTHAIEWVILRPTLIYGLGQDKNIVQIARIVKKFGFFPVLGEAQGLRQPVHVIDVAQACAAALCSPGVANVAYNLSGGEILSYREMVSRVFLALGKRVRLIPAPSFVFRMAVAVIRCLPSYRHWSYAIARRMNENLIFDHSKASQDLGFEPRPFILHAKDLAT